MPVLTELWDNHEFKAGLELHRKILSQKQSRTEETILHVNHLLHKSEELSSDPSQSCKMPGTVTRA